MIGQDIELTTTGTPRSVAGWRRSGDQPFRPRDASRPQVGVPPFRRPQARLDDRRTSELIFGVDVRAGNAGDGDGPPLCSTRCRASTASRSTRCWATWPTAMATSVKPSRRRAPRGGQSPPRHQRGRFPKTAFTIDLTPPRHLPRRARHRRCPQRPRTTRVGGPPCSLFAAGCAPPARCERSARRARAAGGSRSAATRPASPPPALPSRPRHHAPAPPPVEGGTQDRPPPTSRHAPEPLPGTTANQAASVACSDSRQLQAARRPRRVHSHPRPGPLTQRAAPPIPHRDPRSSRHQRHHHRPPQAVHHSRLRPPHRGGAERALAAHSP